MLKVTLKSYNENANIDNHFLSSYLYIKQTRGVIEAETELNSDVLRR